MVRLIKTSVRFALLLRDDYSGKNTAGGGHLFHVNGRLAQPIRKPDGYYVFTDPAGGDYTVTITSAHYCTSTIRIRAGDLPPGQPVETVRLYRRPWAPFSDCEWLEETMRPGALAVALVGWEQPLCLRELSTGGPPGFWAQGYFAPGIAGQRLYLGKGKNRELLAVGAHRSDGSYELERAARKKHSPGEEMLRACCAPCDSAGHCCIPVPPGAKDRIVRLLSYDEEADRWDS